MNKYLNPRFRFILAGLMGLLAMILVRNYLKNAERRLNSRYETATVLVTKKHIALGKDVRPDQVEEKEIPKAFIEPTAMVRSEDLKDTNGKIIFKTRIGLLKGEQVTRSKLIEEGSFTSLAWTLSADQTAISLRLAPDQAVAGHIKPGDWVSVWAVFDVQPGIPEPESTMILTRSQVVGVQGQIWESNEGSSEKIDWKTMSNDFILVTLSVDPMDAGRLAMASEKGRVCLTLLSALNTAPGKTIRMKFAQTLRG